MRIRTMVLSRLAEASAEKIAMGMVSVSRHGPCEGNGSPEFADGFGP